ncbi:MAG: hypothetical protein E7313_00380 [Clostridiales bacterium]|nr:hypothetical protein [Clostridiales bacterium]
MENKYPKAYKEVVEILKYVPKESVDKIPQKMIETFNAKMDNTHNFSIDINKSFEEQELLEETKAILANIFRDYWATPYQKERIQTKERYDRQKLEEEKRANYNSDIFKNNYKTENKKDELSNNNLPIEVKKEKFYEKIINFFKKIFNLN